MIDKLQYLSLIHTGIPLYLSLNIVEQNTIKYYYQLALILIILSQHFPNKISIFIGHLIHAVIEFYYVNRKKSVYYFFGLLASYCLIYPHVNYSQSQKLNKVFLLLITPLLIIVQSRILINNDISSKSNLAHIVICLDLVIVLLHMYYFLSQILMHSSKAYIKMKNMTDLRVIKQFLSIFETYKYNKYILSWELGIYTAVYDEDFYYKKNYNKLTKTRTVFSILYVNMLFIHSSLIAIPSISANLINNPNDIFVITLFSLLTKNYAFNLPIYRIESLLLLVVIFTCQNASLFLISPRVLCLFNLLVLARLPALISNSLLVYNPIKRILLKKLNQIIMLSALLSILCSQILICFEIEVILFNYSFRILRNIFFLFGTLHFLDIVYYSIGGEKYFILDNEKISSTDLSEEWWVPLKFYQYESDTFL